MKERRKWTDAMVEYHKSEDPHSPDNFNSPFPLARWSVSPETSHECPKASTLSLFACHKNSRLYRVGSDRGIYLVDFDFVALNNAA